MTTSDEQTSCLCEEEFSETATATTQSFIRHPTPNKGRNNFATVLPTPDEEPKQPVMAKNYTPIIISVVIIAVIIVSAIIIF